MSFYTLIASLVMLLAFGALMLMTTLPSKPWYLGEAPPVDYRPITLRALPPIEERDTQKLGVIRPKPDDFPNPPCEDTTMIFIPFLCLIGFIYLCVLLSLFLPPN